LYGYFQDDEWQTHAWVLAGNWILDLTADQFGGPDVLIAAADDARYRCGVDDRTRLEPSARAMRAVDFLWTSWQRRVEDGAGRDVSIPVTLSGVAEAALQPPAVRHATTTNAPHHHT
jgi:hypothetical protein